MIIKTKYNIGDIVYIMYNNKIILGEVTGIIIIKSNNMSSWQDNYLRYCINGLPERREVEIEEDKIFKTKEKLLKSL